MTRLYALLAVVAVAIAGVLAVSAGGKRGSSDLKSRLQELSEENGKLRGEVSRLSKEVRFLGKRVAELDGQVQHIEKTLAKAEQDLRSRLKEMVMQERTGRRPFPVRPAVRPVRLVKKPYMGFDAQDLPPDLAQHLKLAAKSGVLITDVRPGSPAAVAGLQKNDVIQRFDDKEIKSFNDLRDAIAGKQPGQLVTVHVQRGEANVVLRIRLGAKDVPVPD